MSPRRVPLPRSHFLLNYSLLSLRIVQQHSEDHSFYRNIFSFVKLFLLLIKDYNNLCEVI